MSDWKAGMAFDSILQTPLDYYDVTYANGHTVRYERERPHGECNQCRYYDGVPGVPGHAPCWYWNIGGVMWNDYCSRFEKREVKRNEKKS